MSLQVLDVHPELTGIAPAFDHPLSSPPLGRVPQVFFNCTQTGDSGLTHHSKFGEELDGIIGERSRPIAHVYE